MLIKLKRAYEAPESDDGFRVLVERLWPRGVAKESAKIDLWLKEIAPTTDLRKWFSHESSRWDRFRDHYFHELDNNQEVVNQLRQHLHHGVVTFVYGSKNEEHNSAVALKAYFESGRDG